ncbi:glycosyltransferase [Pedobacter sp. MW01-1-1]|uniref:glycosyltransferase n=1 Tax=Pedobacter sp. MW01-1-1 TaxID=3383027 RepID=UPI003FF0E9E5
MAKKLLIIGLVWPEPTSSAAGTRMIQLVDLFLKKGYDLHFASAASKSDFSYPLSAIGVTEHAIQLNDSSFDAFIRALQPNIILFDRFMIEEQFGWRVQQECPHAMRMLDTEDLHFLRQARQEANKKGTETELFSDTAKREIAAILRCDLSLIISEEEMTLLQNRFKIDSSLLYYLPFLEEAITPETVKNWVPFTERKDFVFIGNFLHEPNWNTVQFLKTTVWPILRKKMPGVSLHIYGAYAAQKALQLSNKTERFLVQGRAENARETIAKHRILLAPIQFGAGVKGKFIDAMQTGTPSATTPVGAEAMKGDLPWAGIIEQDVTLFMEKTVKLYQDQTTWQQAQQNGIQLLNHRYAKNNVKEDFMQRVEKLFLELTAHRQNNFFGQILAHHSAQSTKYMSLWIQQKNKKSTK